MLLDLGKEGGQNQDLKITVELVEEKAAILQNIKRFRLSSTARHLKHIFITTDFTLRECEVNKALCSELAEGNKSAKQFMIKKKNTESCRGANRSPLHI